MLKPIAEAISKGISSCSQVCNTTCKITFVRGGDQPSLKKAPAGILAPSTIMELTVPWEDRWGEAHEKEWTKYEHRLVIDCRAQGWKVRCMPIEVGSRGFVSLHKALSVLGITETARNRAIKNITEAA